MLNIAFEETALRNGIRVLTAAMPQVESVALGVWVGVGGRYESRRMSGISHFIEHLLFKGTTRRSAREISQAIEGRGGYFNAFTQEESTCYYARIGVDHLWNVFEILADMYLHPKFAGADIEKERGVIIEEIMMYRDRPHNVVEDTLNELLWAAHPLGRPLIGTPENIRRMNRSDILRFKKEKYVASNSIVVFAGKVRHDECVRRVERILGHVRPARKPVYPSVRRNTPQGPSAVLTKSIEQTHLAMGARVFGRHDHRRYALKLLSVILGENMSSRLFQVVRERNGLAYSVHSSMQLYEDTGVLEIQAGLDRGRATRALDLITTELLRFRDKPVSARELRMAKDYSVGQLRLSMESSTSQMIWLGENIMGYGAFTQPQEVIERLERVTAGDIHDVAGQILKRRAVSVAMVVPGDGSRHESAIARQLGRL